MPHTVAELKRQLLEKDSLIAEKDTLIVAKNTVIHQQQDQIQHFQYQLQLQEERLRALFYRRYGAKTEANERQLSLFNEAERLVDQAQSPESAPAVATITVKSFTRRGKRQSLPKHLPRYRMEHDVPLVEQICSCCHQPMRRIGEVKSEQLDIVPQKIVVLEQVRFKYACNHCHEQVKTAALPKQPIPKSNASAGLLAYLVVAKFVDGLPLHRLEQISARLGFPQSRTTLARWMIQVGELCDPLVQRILVYAQQRRMIQVDETTLQVLKESGRAAQSLSYMWVIRAGPPGQVAVFYHYDTRRSSDVLEECLPHYQGYLQCDGFSAYPTYAQRRNNVILVGCFAHAQVKLKESLQVLKFEM